MHRQEFVPELRGEIAQSLGDACLVFFPAAWCFWPKLRRSLKQPCILKRRMILKKWIVKNISMILIMRVEGAYQLYQGQRWQNTVSPRLAPHVLPGDEFMELARWIPALLGVQPNQRSGNLQLDWLSQSPVPRLPTHLRAPAQLICRWGSNSSTPFRWNCHVVEVTAQVSFQRFLPSHCLTAVFYRFWSQQPSGTRLDITSSVRCVWEILPEKVGDERCQ